MQLMDTPAPAATAFAIGAGRPDPYAGRAGRQWWLVISLTALMMLGTIDRQVVSLLINPIKASLGLTDTQISIVYGAAFALANMAFTLPAGYLADKTNRKMLVALGAVGWSIMAMLCGMATGYWQLLGARAGVGFGEGVIGPCSLSMLRSALAPERRGKGFAVFNMATLGGSALALILGGALIGAITRSGLSSLPIVGPVHPWQIVLILMGLAGLPLSLLMATVREPLQAASASAGSETSFRAAFAYMASRWTVYAPLLMYQTLYGLCSLSFGAWIAAMVGRNFGLSIPQIGATLGIMMLILPATGLWIWGLLLDRANARKGVAGMCLVGLATTVFYWLTAWNAPLSPTLPVFWAAFGLHMLFSGAPGAVGYTVIAAITPQAIMGKVAAVQLFIYGLVATAVGPVVVAVVSDNLFSGRNSLSHALSVVTFVYGLSAILTILAVWRAVRREAKAAVMVGPRIDL